MAEAADDPEPADAMGCGRAAVIPAIGSVLVVGHNPFGVFALRVAAQSVPFAGAVPFDCDDDDDADIVEALDACDERLDEELDRWALFRGINMPPPLGTPSALHACRLIF
jgi:hypothetical protein